MSSATFYGRELTADERAIADRLLTLPRGGRAEFGGYGVVRGLFGPYFYVYGASGYHCESLGSTSTAVHVGNLLAAEVR